MARKRTQSAIDKAWRELEDMFTEWDTQIDHNLADEYGAIYYPPTLPTTEAHYTDAAQLAAWRQERG